MDDQLILEQIAEKLNSGMPFALFEDGRKCVFRDGRQVQYNMLWAAIKLLPNQQDNPNNKNLHSLFPQSFEGTFSHRFSNHTWKYKSSSNN